MIAFGVAVHPADALVVAADNARQLLVDVDVERPQQQVSGRRKMRLMRPFGTLQRALEKALADMFN